ncbi:MAG: hypothetical protein EOO38_26945 [Cytophagaceae bacterium]|nr:MAG: hypothetical protein EOO38_26945 [Cytophagaceae bacterium]
MVIKLAAHNQIISNYLIDRYSMVEQTPAILTDAGLASLIGDTIMVTEELNTEPRKIPRYLNQLAMAVIGMIVLSAGLIFFLPKVGIILGFVGFLGVALVGGRVEDFKRVISQSDQANGV